MPARRYFPRVTRAASAARRGSRRGFCTLYFGSCRISSRAQKRISRWLCSWSRTRSASSPSPRRRPQAWSSLEPSTGAHPFARPPWTIPPPQHKDARPRQPMARASACRPARSSARHPVPAPRAPRTRQSALHPVSPPHPTARHHARPPPATLRQAAPPRALTLSFHRRFQRPQCPAEARSPHRRSPRASPCRRCGPPSRFSASS